VASSTALVVPLIVRSPLMMWPSALSRIPVLTKTSSWPASASKKSVERRWPSRCSLFVVIDALLIRTFTRDSAGSSVVTISPENSVKLPRTLLIRWRTLKPTAEWLGSMVQVPAFRPEPTSSCVM
jgi:hypothetical protein